MDTFIDKLAQKLTAQEMIKANAAADAAELQKVKSQVAQYDELLQEIRELSRLNEESARQVQKLTEESIQKLENTDKIDRLVDQCLVKIGEIQQDGQNLEKIETKLGELKQSLEPLFEELTDHVHKENVKVYRNVQAVVVEETAKQSETTTSAVKSLTGKLNAVMGISIAALLVAAAGLAFQILSLLGIL